MQHTHAALQWLWRELRIAIPLALVIALFLSTMFREPFGRMLVYSLCIGMSIQGLIEAGRYALAYRLRKRFPDNI
ncbi:MAG TPA: hypothetical protein VGJ65_10915, partial [Albitalea sp.]